MGNGKKEIISEAHSLSNKLFFSPQTWLDLRAYHYSRWQLKWRFKRWSVLLCSVVWLLNHSGSFLTYWVWNVNAQESYGFESRESYTCLPVLLVPEQPLLPRSCRVSMQKPWSPWHQRLLLEVTPTLTIFNALMSLGCRAQILLFMKSIPLYNCTAADGSEQSKHHYNPYYSRGQNGNWSKSWKVSLSLSNCPWKILLLMRNRSHRDDSTNFNGTIHKELFVLSLK